MTEEKKAYDLKDLEAKLKANGMPHVEGMAKAAVESIFEWLEESAVISATPIDDMAAAFYPSLKKIIVAKVEEIS